MKSFRRFFSLIALLCSAFFPLRGGAGAAFCPGAFIQLNAELAARDDAWWAGLFARMARAGIREAVVQYLAEGPGGPGADYLPVLDRLFFAAEAQGIGLVLGLEYDPDFWGEITAPEKVLRDYFLVRVGRNLRLQKRLLERYSGRSAWAGYYISDEIDDLSWRDPGRREILQGYFRLLTSRIREADPAREISVSAFFRGRTEPAHFARNLFELVGVAFDRILVQDGQGGGDPGIAFLPLYYQALLAHRPRPDRLRLSPIVEFFEETIDPAGAFAARPADPTAVARRLRTAAADFSEIYIFSFPAYADPEGGERSAALYNLLLSDHCSPSRLPAPQPSQPSGSASGETPAREEGVR